MERESGKAGVKHADSIIAFFDNEMRWWSDVYREQLPRGFFSFEMRRRLDLVTELLSVEIQKRDCPRVLEGGCGPGDILSRLSSLRCKLTGLDLNQRYLDMAEERIPGATWIRGDVECLPFPDCSFDVVLSVGVLSYLRDDRSAVSEIARVTKDEGCVLVSVPNYRMLHLFFDPYYLYRGLKRAIGLEKRDQDGGFDESKMHRYPLPELLKLLREAGLVEVQTMTTSYGPLKLWRREILPLAASVRISEFLRGWSTRRSGTILKRFGNHFIVVLRKAPSVTGISDPCDRR